MPRDDGIERLKAVVDSWVRTTEQFSLQMRGGFVPHSVALREFETAMHETLRGFMAQFPDRDSRWYEAMMELAGQAKAKGENDRHGITGT